MRRIAVLLPLIVGGGCKSNSPADTAAATAPLDAVDAKSSEPAPASPTIADVPPESTSPTWVKDYQPVLDASWSLNLTGLVAASGVSYLEHEGLARLCLIAEESRCYNWPEGLPTVTSVDASDGDKGTIELQDAKAMHSLSFEVVQNVLRVEHRQSVKSPSPTDGFAYTKPKRQLSSKPAKAPKWQHGSLTLEATPAKALVPVLDALAALAIRKADSDSSWHFQTILRDKETLWNLTERLLGEIDSGWLCHRRPETKARCVEAGLDRIVVLASDISGWLLLVNEPGPRSGYSYLARLDTQDSPSLALAKLAVGSMEGTGESCGFAKGYCLWMEGLATEFEVLSPSCVRIGASTSWSAVHVRAKNQYVKRKEAPAKPGTEPLVGTYAPSGGTWIKSSCGDETN